MTQKALTKANYARHIGKSRQYVNELVRNGRTVQNANGLILVAETDALVFETSDPSKVGVVERHAIERAEKQDTEITAADLKPIGNIPAFQESKARKEFYAAENAEIEYKKAKGELLVAEDVVQVIYKVMIAIRTRIEALPDRLSVMLAAESDAARVKSMLTEEFEHALTELSNLKKLGNA